MSEHFTRADLGAIPPAAAPLVNLTPDEADRLAAKVAATATLAHTPLTWAQLRAWTPDLTLEARRRVFAALPDEQRLSVWNEQRLDRVELVLPEDKRATAKPLRDVSRPRQDRGDLTPVLDVLRALPATEYVAVLARVDVPAGGMIRCPLPGHEDRTPSFHADAGDRGWYCHGCGKGGGVIDLAGHLWNRPTNGPTFPDLVREIHGCLLSAGRAAA